MNIYIFSASEQVRERAEEAPSARTLRCCLRFYGGFLRFASTPRRRNENMKHFIFSTGNGTQNLYRSNILNKKNYYKEKYN